MAKMMAISLVFFFLFLSQEVLAGDFEEETVVITPSASTKTFARGSSFSRPVKLVAEEDGVVTRDVKPRVTSAKTTTITRNVNPTTTTKVTKRQEENSDQPDIEEQEGDDGAPNSEVDGGFYFSDPSYDKQWHLQNLGIVPGQDLIDLAVVPAWAAGYSGKGVTVAVVDSKLEFTLPDLKPNINESLYRDFNTGYPDTYRYPDHAVAVAGLIGAVANNEYCGAGVAFHSSLASIRLLDGPTSDTTDALAMNWKYNEIDVYSCNFGPSDDGYTLQGPGPITTDALENGAINGRKGLGSVYVWAAGNGGKTTDNCNYDGYANNPYTVAVGAIASNGKYASYSEPCAAMLTTAPGGDDPTKEIPELVGITTTDTHDCTHSFIGTDSSAPQVAGAVALMLEANPQLTWRDVQTILVKASRGRLTNGGPKGVNNWLQNAAGFWHNDHYGFGLLNASKAVFLAKEWKTLPPRYCFKSNQIAIEKTIPDNGTALSSTIRIDQASFYAEHVRVYFSAVHGAWGDIAVNLTSPGDTVSRLAVLHAQGSKKGRKNPQYQGWPFLTVKNWGENPSGDWVLSVADEVADEFSGQFQQWQLEVCGYYTSGAPPPTPTPQPIYKTDDTPVIETVYEENRSATLQLAAIFWRFLVVMFFLGLVIAAAAFFVSPRPFVSWFGTIQRRVSGQRRNADGIFDPGDDL